MLQKGLENNSKVLLEEPITVQMFLKSILQIKVITYCKFFTVMHMFS